MKKLKLTSAICGALTVAAVAVLPAQVSAYTVIDFDTDPDGNNIANGAIINTQYSSQGVTISANNADSSVVDRAVAFDTRLSGTADPDLQAPFYDFIEADFDNASDKGARSFAGDARDGTNGVSNPGNVLVIQENNNCSATICNIPDDEGSNPGGSFTIEFDAPVFLKYIDFFDVEVTENNPSNSIVLTDANNNEISPGTFFTPNTGGDFNVANTSYNGTAVQGNNNSWDRLFFNTALVKMIHINMGGSGGIDNIAYRADVPVPAPATLLLLGGYFLWRRSGVATATRKS